MEKERSKEKQGYAQSKVVQYIQKAETTGIVKLLWHGLEIINCEKMQRNVESS